MTTLEGAEEVPRPLVEAPSDHFLKKSENFASCKTKSLEAKDPTCGYGTWPSKIRPHQSDAAEEKQEKLAKHASLDSIENLATKSRTLANDSLKPNQCDRSLTLSEALENLSFPLTYNPHTKGLHIVEDGKKEESEKEEKMQEIRADVPEVVEQDRNEVKICDTVTRYTPGHRKAFSLPRTLEVVNEDGSIAEVRPPPLPPNLEIESPRSTLLRFKMEFGGGEKTFDGESAISSMSSLSSRTDFSTGPFDLSETSSRSDSGYSEGSGWRPRQAKKGLTEFFSKGISANWKLLSKSGQQVVKLMRRPESAAEEDSLSSVASSQSLIMQDRPDGLPAKDTEELEKHSLLHKQIIDSSKKREQLESRERAKKLAEQRRMEDDLSAAVTLWSSSILPNWSSVSNNKKTRSTWWRGLPPPVRGRVWKLALQNHLNITPQLYAILVNRASQQIQSWYAYKSTVSNSEETLELIPLDVSRTFPQLCIFQKGGPYYNLLHNVLGAYVCYRPDIGYVQGMSFIAAILILNLDEADAFILFANLINKPCLQAFFNMDQELMSKYFNTFSIIFSFLLPDLCQHFSNLGLRPDLFLLDWIMTLFARAAPLDVTCRIWDILIRDGEEFLFRAAFGILSMYEDVLLKEHDFVNLAQFLSRLPDDINGDILFKEIEGIQLVASKKTFQQILSQV